MSLATRHPMARAFTLVELIVVIVVLAILSGVAIPKYFDYAAKAKESACKGTLGAVRSGIANFHANSIVSNGAATWPTLVQMQTLGTVMQEPLPANPYNNSNTIQAATWATTPPVSGTAGWSYDAATGKFWANSNTSGIGEHLW
ncbi:MAG: prepilin-type N-terminal cleavage/methylation domain-containing protein [Phycisphaeraceae bacterium]|nr:prepilin-type N-terminal cleavage/methylation domain-containing protein [Phycisphaeraceae bacterium]